MKIAIIGASGKTGSKVVREALDRGHEVVAVCREGSVSRLDEFAGHKGFTVMAAPMVSDEATLTRALQGCDAVVAVLISIGKLKATDMVASLAKATAANNVKRLVFTAGEVTVVREKGETFTFRQRIMLAIFTPVSWVMPFSLGDMKKASVLVRQQSDWDWTIMRAPTLRETPPVGYELCELSDVTGSHALSRDDYAACMLDSLENPEHHRRMLTVISADG